MGQTDHLSDFCPSCHKILWEQTKAFPNPAQRFFHNGEHVPVILELGASYSIELSNCTTCESPLFANILDHTFVGISIRALYPIKYSDKERRSEMSIQLRRLAKLRQEELVATLKESIGRESYTLITPAWFQALRQRILDRWHRNST